jgi:hypothetical protein
MKWPRHRAHIWCQLRLMGVSDVTPVASYTSENSLEKHAPFGPLGALSTLLLNSLQRSKRSNRCYNRAWKVALHPLLQHCTHLPACAHSECTTRKGATKGATPSNGGRGEQTPPENTWSILTQIKEEQNAVHSLTRTDLSRTWCCVSDDLAMRLSHALDIQSCAYPLPRSHREAAGTHPTLTHGGARLAASRGEREGGTTARGGD